MNDATESFPSSEDKCDVEYCSICLDEMDTTSRYQKYTCLHYFHKRCISNWNRNCPICRNVSMKINSNIHIQNFKNLPNKVPLRYYNIYLDDWKKQECKNKNHDIFFRRPYGVLGGCETCGYTQAFNLCHPI